MASKPTHRAYTVRDYKINDTDKSHWLEIGVAFLHKDGKGFDLNLQAVPVDGRVVVRLSEPKDKMQES